MSDLPIHVVAVLNEATNHEALYVGGDLKAADETLYMGDVAVNTKGLVIEFSQITVDFGDDMDFPNRLEEILQYVIGE